MANTSHLIRRWAPVLTLMLMLVACGDGGEGGGVGSGGAPGSSAVLGPAGGTVLGPNGAKVVIPPGALSADTVIGIEQTSAGAPPLPAGFAVFGPMFAFTPHGTSFAVPATVTLPFDPAAVPAGAEAALYKTTAGQRGWAVIDGATVNGSSMTAQVTSFSLLTVGSEPEPPLVRLEPKRFWHYMEFPGDGSAQKPVSEMFSRVGAPQDKGGEVKHFHEYGPHKFEFGGDEDGKARGSVFSSADGKSYSVRAESPEGQIGNGDTAIGSLVVLDQVQSFRKTADNATLKLVVTAIRLQGSNFQPTDIISFECTKNPIENPGTPESTPCKDGLYAFVDFDVMAYSSTTPINFWGQGNIELRHIGSAFNPPGSPEWSMQGTKTSAPTVLWGTDAFVLSKTVGPRTEVTLLRSVPIEIDLSKVGLEKEFTVRIRAEARTFNEGQGESYLSAYFRDPVEEGGGATMEFTGLVPTNDPLPEPPEDSFHEAADCTTGIDPEAGVLEFNAGSFGAMELPIPGSQPIHITRTGGSKGAVSVRFTAGDGTASAGSDYSAVSKTVSFADGDTQPRTVEVPFLLDTVGEPDETVNLTLSDARGCAALGAQTSAVLTILDNDRPLPQNAFSVGGTVTGLVGSGLVLRHITTGENLAAGNGAFTFTQQLAGGFEYNVAVGTQPLDPLQICTVTDGRGTVATANITSIAVSCVTPGNDSGLDSTFGEGGKVTTGLAGGATSMALQSDGKLLLLGKRTLGRYNTNGSVDTSFGTGGQVTIVFNGGIQDAAQGLAIQADGKIVVVGFTRVGTNDDFAVARYDTSGALDATFGTGGKVSADFSGLVDQARAVLIQANGSIVVAGHASRSVPAGGDNDFAVARFTSSGTPDPTFGTGGKVTTEVSGRTDLAFAAALQEDGKIVVTGGVGLVRYTAAGGLDPTFGTGGITRLDSTGNTIVVADDLAIQSDGKIVVAGHAGVGQDIGFALARFTASGAPDLAFGTSGVVTTTFTTQDDYGRGVALQGDGKIVVIGQSSNLLKPDFAVARFTSAGTPDPSFGTGGKLTVDFFGVGDDAQDVAIQADGKIVVSGAATNGTSLGVGLVRINP